MSSKEYKAAWYQANKEHLKALRAINRTKTLTERIAKRIRRGQPWATSSVSDATILRWAEQYAMVRSFGQMPR